MLYIKVGIEMGRIRLVLKQDLKRIFTNELTFVVIFMMLILPTIFAVFTIKANQTTIHSTKKIKMALINRDKGGIIDNTQVNIGDKIASYISQEEGINWEIVSYEDALSGALTGRYYGKVIIPEDFTENVASLNTENRVFPKVLYDINFSKNMYAPTFNTVNNVNFQTDIQKSIIYTINKVIKNTVGELNIDIEVEPTDTRQLVEAILDLNLNKEIYLNEIAKYKELAGTLMILLTNLDTELANSEQSIKKIEDMQLGIYEFLDIVKELEVDCEKIVGKELTMETHKMLELVQELSETANSIEVEISEIQAIIQEVREITVNVYTAFDQAYDAVIELSKRLNDIGPKLGLLSREEDINTLIYNLRNHPDLVAEYLESPVLLEKIDTSKMFGDNMIILPFYMVIAIWLGKTILITVLASKFQGRIAKDDEILDDVTRISRLQEYFAKGLFFVILGCIQDLLMISSINNIFDIGSINYGLLLGVSILGGITFTTMTYTLVSIFGDIGKVVVHSLSVFQVFLLGGVYPLQIIPEIFFNINKGLPFVYLISSFRELGVGLTTSLSKSVIILVLFIVYTVIFGVIGKWYLTPYIDKLGQILGESNLMNNAYK